MVYKYFLSESICCSSLKGFSHGEGNLGVTSCCQMFVINRSLVAMMTAAYNKMTEHRLCQRAHPQSHPETHAKKSQIL